MRRQVGLAEGTTTMLSYLIVSGLCLLLLLHIVCKVWQNALEIHSAADNLDEACDLAARGQPATNDSECNSSKTGWLESSPPKCCHVW
jgi:hypothetical protein